MQPCIQHILKLAIMVATSDLKVIWNSHKTWQVTDKYSCNTECQCLMILPPPSISTPYIQCITNNTVHDKHMMLMLYTPILNVILSHINSLTSKVLACYIQQGQLLTYSYFHFQHCCFKNKQCTLSPKLKLRCVGHLKFWSTVILRALCHTLPTESKA